MWTLARLLLPRFYISGGQTTLFRRACAIYSESPARQRLTMMMMTKGFSYGCKCHPACVRYLPTGNHRFFFFFLRLPFPFRSCPEANYGCNGPRPAPSPLLFLNLYSNRFLLISTAGELMLPSTVKPSASGRRTFNSVTSHYNVPLQRQAHAQRHLVNRPLGRILPTGTGHACRHVPATLFGYADLANVLTH